MHRTHGWIQGGLRLLGAALLGVGLVSLAAPLWHMPLLVALCGYGMLVALLPLWPTAVQARLWPVLPVLDAALVALCLWAVPALPMLALLVPCALLLGRLSGLGDFALLVEGFVLLLVGLARAHLLGDLQGSNPQWAHFLAVFLSLSVLAQAHVHGNEAQVQRAAPPDDKTPPVDGVAHLLQALHYLHPLHIRNHLPLTLLMLRVPTPDDAKTLQSRLQARLRASDLCVGVAPLHLVLLLPDTDETGAQKLAAQLRPFMATACDCAMAACCLPTQAVALQLVLARLHQALEQHPDGATRIGVVRMQASDLAR